MLAQRKGRRSTATFSAQQALSCLHCMSFSCCLNISAFNAITKSDLIIGYSRSSLSMFVSSSNIFLICFHCIVFPSSISICRLSLHSLIACFYFRFWYPSSVSTLGNFSSLIDKLDWSYIILVSFQLDLVYQHKSHLFNATEVVGYLQ